MGRLTCIIRQINVETHQTEGLNISFSSVAIKHTSTFEKFGQINIAQEITRNKKQKNRTGYTFFCICPYLGEYIMRFLRRSSELLHIFLLGIIVGKNDQKRFNPQLKLHPQFPEFAVVRWWWAEKKAPQATKER